MLILNNFKTYYFLQHWVCSGAKYTEPKDRIFRGPVCGGSICWLMQFSTPGWFLVGFSFLVSFWFLLPIWTMSVQPSFICCLSQTIINLKNSWQKSLNNLTNLLWQIWPQWYKGLNLTYCPLPHFFFGGGDITKWKKNKEGIPGIKKSKIHHHAYKNKCVHTV